MADTSKQSTFDRMFAQTNAPAPQALSAHSIASIYDAYQNGKMTPEQTADFEQDVKAGVVMLPRGAALKGQSDTRNKVEPVTLPLEVTNAYVNNQMTEQQRADLEEDIKAGLVKLPPTLASLIPSENPDAPVPTEQGIVTRPQAPTLGQQLTGAGEAALTTATGATGGALGMLSGSVEGIAKSIIDDTFTIKDADHLAADRAAALTYAPRTELGAEYAKNVGDVMSQAVPLMPMTAELGAISSGLRQAAPVARAQAVTAANAVKTGAQALTDSVKPQVVSAVNAVKNAPGRAMELVGLGKTDAIQNAARGGGADIVPLNVVRANTAESLPVPIELTRGAESRNATQLAFEKEQMKGAAGGPLRQRAEENNLQALQNFDALIDMTKAEMPDLASTGNKVTKALAQGYEQAKNETRAAYTKAQKSEEAQRVVDPNAPIPAERGLHDKDISLVDYLNGKIEGVPSSAVPDTAKKLALNLGIASKDDAGNLVGKQSTVAQMEAFRKELNGTAKWDDKVGLREETIIKKMIDAQTEPVAGPLYKAARALRTQQARKYENRAIVARLINNRKGMDDPTVAADQVFNRTIMNGSPEEITFVKRVLNTSGANGQQGWKELQGALIRHLKEKTTEGVGMDSNNNPIVSAAKLNQAVNQLDKNGRLEIVLGKKNAEVVRDLNDVVRYVNTVPPGTLVNHSGTVGALLAAMAEAGVTGSLTGLPVPLLSILKAMGNHIKSKRLRAQVEHALNRKPVNEQVKKVVYPSVPVKIEDKNPQPQPQAH